jgi:hypothetical protein
MAHKPRQSRALRFTRDCRLNDEKAARLVPSGPLYGDDIISAILI